MKKMLLPLLLALFTLSGVAQTIDSLTIEDCYRLARENYPLARQRELITKSRDYSLENASKAYLPQFAVYGQATYQSDVTTIPIKIIGVEIPILSKDQYRIYTELTQTIYDGGNIRNEKRLVDAQSEIETQQLEVDLYKLKERINNLFFGILLINEQIAQNELLKNDIQLGLKKVEAAIANGTAFRSNADQLKAELLKADQQTIALHSNRKAYLQMLGLFVNQPLSEQTQLVKPASVAVSQEIKRPELTLFDYQSKQLDIRTNQINSAFNPKLNFFVQGGAGLPGLDMLKNEFVGFYLGGIRLSWSLSKLYTQKKEKELVSINKNSIAVQKETFLFNTRYALQQQNEDINKLQKLISSDEEIIALRTNVKNTSLAQLENGVITTNDYLTQVNAENSARQTRSLNEVQLLLTLYQQRTTTGN